MHGKCELFRNIKGLPSPPRHLQHSALFSLEADPDLNLKKSSNCRNVLWFLTKAFIQNSLQFTKQSFCDPVFRVLSPLPLHKRLEAELMQTKAQNTIQCSTSLQKCLIFKLLSELPTLLLCRPARIEWHRNYATNVQAAE